MEYPLISVIVLIYRNYLEAGRTIQSILAQDYPNIEIIVSDDASNDFPMDELKSQLMRDAGQNVKRILTRQNDENLGTVKHINLAASFAQGRYIKFLAPGDVFYNMNSLKSLYYFIIDKHEILITSVASVTSPDGQEEYYKFPSERRVKVLNATPTKNLFSKLAFCNIIAAEGVLFHCSFFRLEEGMDEAYKLLEDWPLWLRVTRENKRIPCLDQVTVKYALGGVSSSAGTAFESEKLRKDMILCYEKEVLPYWDRLSISSRFFCSYEYKKLKFYGTYSKYEKIVFLMRYFPYEAYRWGKAVLKKFIIVTIHRIRG